MRKVSEVILTLESDVKELKAMIKNQDLLLKLILQSVKKDSLTQSVPNALVVEKQSVQNLTQAKPMMPGLKPGVVMGPNGLQNKPTDDEDYEFPEVETAVPT